jgi:hypothetical protein
MDFVASMMYRYSHNLNDMSDVSSTEEVGANGIPSGSSTNGLDIGDMDEDLKFLLHRLAEDLSRLTNGGSLTDGASLTDTAGGLFPSNLS